MQNILHFVGPGQHLYISTISKLARQCYLKVKPIEVPVHRDGALANVVVTSQTTQCSEMSRSKSRLVLAVQHGVQLAPRGSIMMLQRTADSALAARNKLYKCKLERAQVSDPQWKHKVALGRFADKLLLSFAYDELSLSPFSAYVTLGAVVSGNLDKLKWLHVVKGATMFMKSSVAAAQYGHAYILNWFYQIEFHVDAEASREAAFHGHLNVLQLLHIKGHKWHKDTALYALIAGRLDTLQWLGEHGCAYDVTTMTSKAAYYGHVHILDWLLTLQLDAVVMQAAAKGGQLRMCQHLRSIGCDWDHTVSCAAAEHGHIHVLVWLRASGCPCEYTVLALCAASGGSTAMMQHILEQSALQFEFTHAEVLIAMLLSAGASSKVAAAKWLRQQGAEWPPVLSITMDSMMYNWQGDVLQWARAEGCTSPIQ
eukprot:10021-Heterococcus_DN1.PRE.1